MKKKNKIAAVMFAVLIFALPALTFAVSLLEFGQLSLSLPEGMIYCTGAENSRAFADAYDGEKEYDYSGMFSDGTPLKLLAYDRGTKTELLVFIFDSGEAGQYGIKGGELEKLAAENAANHEKLHGESADSAYYEASKIDGKSCTVTVCAGGHTEYNIYAEDGIIYFYFEGAVSIDAMDLTDAVMKTVNIKDGSGVNTALMLILAGAAALLLLIAAIVSSGKTAARKEPDKIQ